MKLTPVSADEQVAFKAEIPDLRRRLRAITHARRKLRPDVTALSAQLESCRARLDYWNGVLTVGHHIRSPVRLWDTLNRLTMVADFNAEELGEIQRVRREAGERLSQVKTQKRYFAIIWPKHRGPQAALLAGYERDGRIIARDERIGFALDYYPEEAVNYKRDFGASIVGDFATRQEAEAAIERALSQ